MLSDALPGPSPSVRLVSASFWPAAGSPLGHLLALRRRLLPAVQARGVRLAVLHRAQWLVLWIEGTAGAVESAWQRIQREPELEASRVVHRSAGPSWLPEPVHIAAVFRREEPRQVVRQLAALADLSPSEAEPSRLWHELVAPAAVPPGRTVVLASAQEHDGIDLLRQVAQAHGSEVVYQRFAGADPAQTDSGAAYTDVVADCGCCTRLHVLSRRCLGHALVRGGVGEMSDVMLLLGARTVAAGRLAGSLLPLLAERGRAVRVHLAGREASGLAQAEGVLRAQGAAAAILPHLARTADEEARALAHALAGPVRRPGERCPAWDRSRVALAA
jgi:hypothetical protein